MAASITEGVLWELRADDSQLVAAYRRAESASARAGDAAARAAEKSGAAYQGLTRKVDVASGALKDNSAAIGLNRAQMLQSIHVAKAFVDQVIAGQSPMRALAVEGGRIGQIFSSGTGGAGATAAAFGNIALRALTSPVGAAVTLGGAILGIKAAGDAAAESLATLAEESRRTGLTPNRITGAKIVGARAGLDDKETVGAFANAQKEFEAYARNGGQVKEILEKVDKEFLKVADSARSSSEWIDKIIQKIRDLPIGQGLNLAKALFGDEAGRKLFDEIQRGSVSMASLSQEAEKAGANFDISAQHAESMKNQIAEAEKIASTKLLAAFGDLATPSLAIERAWANVKGSIADAVKGARDLIDVPALRKAQSQREGALAGAEIGRLLTGKDPFAGKNFSDVDPLVNLFTHGQKPRTVGEDRKDFVTVPKRAKGQDEIKAYLESLRLAEEKSKADVENWRLGNVERQKAVALAELESRARKEGRAATEAERTAALAHAANIGVNQDNLEKLTETQQRLNAAAQEFANRMASGLEEIILRGKNAKEVLADMAKQLASSALRSGFENVFVGDTRGKSQGGGLLSRLLGGLLGGDKGLFSGAPFKFNFGGFFADGGSLPPGKWGIAGEAGPEFIQGPATITPFGKMGGGSGSPNIIIHNNASVDVTPQVTPRAIMLMIDQRIGQNNKQRDEAPWRGNR